ncbi:MAG: sensor histidine kinase [Myxococcota bacterium]
MSLGLPSPTAIRDPGGLRFVTRAAVAVAIITAGLAAARLALDGPGSPVGRVLAGVAVACLLVPGATTTFASPRLGGALLCAVGIAGTLGMARVEDGLYSEALFWVPFVPLLAALVVGRLAAWVAAGVAIAGLALVAWEQAGGGVAGPVVEPAKLVLRLAGAAGATLFGAALGVVAEDARRHATRVLEGSEASLRELVEAVPDAMWRLTPDGGASLVHRRADDLGDAPPEVVHALGELAREGSPSARRVVSAAGREHEIRTVGRPSGTRLALVRDLTAERAAERAKEEFVAVVSHELRTPLTSIRGALGLLRSGAVEAHDSEVLLEAAERNAARLGRLVEDLLELQTPAGGSPALATEVVPLGELVHDGVERVRPAALAKGVGLAIDAVPDARVRADPARLREALGNLLANAIKFSPAGTSVRVEVRRTPGGVVVAVRDRGPGIPEAFRPRVFEPFAQADSSATRAAGGTGLGLAIARRVVEEHGGSLTFESEEGIGTAFFVGLPEWRG